MSVAETFLSERQEPQRAAPVRARQSITRALFGSLAACLTTLLLAAVLLAAIPKLLAWAVINGVWSGGAEACRDAGACWVFLRAKYRFILFGIYPPGEHWRPALVIALFVGLTLWSLPRHHWTRTTLFLWVGGVATALLLMGGGILGLTPVPTSAWGGLPITLLLTVLSLGFGFPFAVLLALGRRSDLPAIRLVCIGFIEVVRALPLLSLLFIAAILIPILLPEGMTIDNLFRALVALTISSSAYLAEVVRGGLQGVEPGQNEAARALGLSGTQTLRLIVLPQAIRKVIPPLTNTIVVTVKNTSLVLVVGLFDLLSAGRAALADPAWPGPYAETYLAIATLYFIICFSISRYSRFLELGMANEVRR